ncbi:hypothetical protein KDA08_04895, partial [Candidatus Saccharibacteria bacterium]|nr:hypothetical protein [Candidatus Saccharibacteria bacterium]
KIKEAQKNLLSNLKTQHKKEMASLDKGDQKVEGAMRELILKAANNVASDFAVSDKEADNKDES